VSRRFSAPVHFACRVTYGSRTGMSFSGTAVRLDSNSVEIEVASDPEAAYPGVGESVEVEMDLPVTFDGMGGKCLVARGRVTKASETNNGCRQFVMTFRKAMFREPAANAKQSRPARGSKRTLPGVSLLKAWEM
jgi:hypothetical protein